jgi:hypothetical protein
VGDAAAGFAVVFEVALAVVVVELSTGAAVVVGARKSVDVVVVSAAAASRLFPSSPPQAPVNVSATTNAAIALVPMIGRA